MKSSEDRNGLVRHGKEMDEFLLELDSPVVNDESFIKGNDEIVRGLFSAEQSIQEGLSQIDEPDHENCLISKKKNLRNALTGTNCVEPLSIEEIQDDNSLLSNNMDKDFRFKRNSAKLDDFLSLKNHPNSKNNHQAEMSEVRLNESDELWPDAVIKREFKGKRRRTSFPQDLRCENPFEPTPISSPRHDSEYSRERPKKHLAIQAFKEKVNLVSSDRQRVPRRLSLPGMHLNYPGTESKFSRVNSSNVRKNETRIGVEPQLLSQDLFVKNGRRSSSQPVLNPLKIKNGLVLNISQNELKDMNGVGNPMPFQDDEATIPSTSFDPRTVASKTLQRRSSTGSYYDLSTRNEGEFWNASLVVPETLEPKVMMKRLRELMKKSSKTQKALQQWDKDNGLPKSHSQTMVNTSRSRRQLQDGVILPKWDGSPLISNDTELGKPRPRSKSSKREAGGKLQRRMSAPASSNHI